MHESAADLAALQELIDHSYENAGAHLLRIHTPERRLRAGVRADRGQANVRVRDAGRDCALTGYATRRIACASGAACRSSAPRNAVTTIGSNWVPEHRKSSSRAAIAGMPGR